MPKCMRCMADYEQQEYCPVCGTPAKLPVSDRGQLPHETILNRRFIIGNVVSRDRIGFTYVAWDALLDRKVVIKEWMPERLSERDSDHLRVVPSLKEELWRELNDRFLLQAEMLHRNQNISVLVPVYTFFEENHTSYYVMEFTEGQTLRKMVSRENPLELSVVQELDKKVERALEILHEAGMVHGNLTPDNIFLCRDGNVKFLNFAWFGKSLEELPYGLFESSYASPLYCKTPVKPDKAMDAYSSAAVSYRLVTGEEPCPAAQRIKKDKLPAVSDYGIEIPSHTEKELLQRMKIQDKKGSGLLRILQGMSVLLSAVAVALAALIVF